MTTKALGPGRQSSGTAGRPHGNPDPSASRPGELFNTTTSQTLARVPRDSWLTPRALRHRPDLLGQLSILKSLGPGPMSPATAGRPCGPSDMSTSHLRELVDTAGLRTLARMDRESWLTLRTIGHERRSTGTAARPTSPQTLAQVTRDSWLNPRALGNGRESPGLLFEPAGTRTRARVTRESWWTPRALGRWLESPGTAGRPRGQSDPVPNCPG